MMRWIVGASLRLQKLVLAAALGVVVLGIVQVTKASVDLLPEYQPPTVEVQTEALGLSAAEVEQLITVPLEQDLLVGVPFLDEITSVSLPGISSVVMTFEPGTDVLDARQVVQERLTQAVGVAGLPAVAKTPQMIQPVSSDSRVAMVKLTSEQLSPIEMSVLARWVISPRLLGVPGVANVAIWGNRERQLQVLVDPERLQARGVTLPEVVRTAGNALEVSQLSYLEASKPGTGGFIDTPNQRLNIFHQQAISNPEELAQVPLEGPDGEAVAGSSGPLTLGDVTKVVEDHQPLIGDTACGDGTDCLLLVVEKFPGANTEEVTAELDTALKALQSGLGDMQIDSSVYRPASHIEAAVSHLGWALLAGAALLVAALLLLLRDWRRTVATLAAVAVSLAAAILVLEGLDVTVNVLVMVGLVVGLTAMLVDAVTDTDVTGERMRQHRKTGTTAPVWDTIVASTVGLRRAALFAALVVVAGTLPLLFLADEGAAFVPPIVLTYLLAVAVSFVVALVLTPALSLAVFERQPVEERARLGGLRRRYAAVAPRAVRRVGPALVVAGCLALVAVVTAPFLTTSFRPALQERDLVVSLEAPAGTSLPRMSALTEQAVRDLGAIPGVKAANAQIGRAVMSDKVVNVNQGEVWVSLDDGADYDATVASIEDIANGYPGLTSEVTTYTTQRVGEVFDTNDADVSVRVYGEDADVLSAKAQEIRAAVADVDGVTGVSIAPTPTENTLEVQVALDRAQALGVKPGDVRRAAAMLVGGVTVGNLFQEQKVFDVVVWGDPAIRSSAEDLRNLLIDTPGGKTIRLGEVATVAETPNPALIRHEDVARYVQVDATVSGRSAADVSTEVSAAIASIDFPLDHHAEIVDGYADQRATTVRLLSLGLAAGLVAFLLLQSFFRSWRLAGLAFVAIPLSLVGCLVALPFTDGEITLGVVAGLVATFGLATHLVVAAIGRIVHLHREEGEPWRSQLVVRATGNGLTSTAVVTAATVAVMAPVAVAGFFTTGLEVVGPAALAVLGGLVTTLVVGVYVLPAVVLKYGSGEETDSWVDELSAAEPTEPPAPVKS